jgi:hypothetical protein
LDNCTFTTSSSYTPTITAVSPNTVSDSNTEITIDGQNFGIDSSNITVRIGDQNCLVSSVLDTQLNCTINGLSVGDQPVVVTTSIFIF